MLFPEENFVKNSDDLMVLRELLSLSLESESIFDYFEKLFGLEGKLIGEGCKRFFYRRSQRENAVLLMAHADTVAYSFGHIVGEDDEKFFNKTGEILGADDRAGCAMCAILGRELGHGVLILDGEESGQIGAIFLRENQPKLFSEICTWYNFLVEFDRRNKSDFKCYEVGSDDFRTYLENTLGFTEPDRYSATDICTIGKPLCGVNLSAGYYNEHTKNECILKAVFLNNLSKYRKWLGNKDLPVFVSDH